MCICGLKRTIFRNGTLKSSINTGRYTADYLQCGNLPYLAWKKRMTVHILSYRRIRRYLALSLKATEEHVTSSHVRSTYWYGTLLKKHCGSILTLDGQYGSRTRKASLTVWKDVVNRLYGGKLSFDGELFDSECMNTARTIVLSFGSSGTLTAIAEGILAAEGMYLGNIDAQFGTEMKKSTKAFQMKYGLVPDGEAFFYIHPKKTLVRKMEV